MVTHWPRVGLELPGQLKTMIQVWQNKMFDLRTWTAGMCYTYNPPNKSDTLLTSRFDDSLRHNRLDFSKQADCSYWRVESVGLGWVSLLIGRFLQNTLMTMTCKVPILFRFWCLPPRKRPILAKARLLWPWRQGVNNNYAHEAWDKNMICDNHGKVCKAIP